MINFFRRFRANEYYLVTLCARKEYRDADGNVKEETQDNRMFTYVIRHKSELSVEDICRKFEPQLKVDNYYIVKITVTKIDKAAALAYFQSSNTSKL